MNWRSGAISINLGQSGHVRELTLPPPLRGPTQTGPTGRFGPPQRPSRYGLQAGIASDASSNDLARQAFAHECGQRADEGRIVVERIDPLELESQLVRLFARLNVD